MHHHTLLFNIDKWSTTRFFFPSKQRIETRRPLVSFLFIISIELLSRILYKVEEHTLLKEIEMTRNGSLLSHIQFVNDLLILCRASDSNAIVYMLILGTFYSWSGQEINTEKFGMMFSRKRKRQLKK